MTTPTPRLDPHGGDLFAWNGRSLLVTSPSGEIDGHSVRGLWSDNTRMLSDEQFYARGRQIVPFAASAAGSTGQLAYAQVETERDGREPKIHVRISRFLDQGLRTEYRLESVFAEPIDLEIKFTFDADFADIEEARLGQRRQNAEISWEVAGRSVKATYLHPGLDWASLFSFEGWEPALAPGRAKGSIRLHHQEPVTLAVIVEPVKYGEVRPSLTRSFANPADAQARRVAEVRALAPKLITSNAAVQRAWDTAIHDLPGFGLGLEGAPLTPFAGLPMYHQFFGRDSLTTAGQAAWAFPEMLKDALVANAFMQGRTFDDWRDEEPGKLIHQARQSPLADLDMTPNGRYYGDFSAPQDFVIMLAAYVAWTNDRDTARQLMPTVEAIMRWGESVDIDGDGFLEYDTRSSDGVKNQGWKDSGDAIVDADGEIVPNPITASDVQAYWFAALRAAGLLWLLLGRPAKAIAYRNRAARMATRFGETFLLPSGDLYATALGPDKKPVGMIGSNVGHAIAMGIAPPETGRRVARRLMEPDLFSGWGVRTLSSEHAAFDPLAYHLGTVWPIENSTFVWGFGRYGCVREMWELARAFFDLTELFDRGRLPEVLGGYPRDPDHPHPGLWPRSNSPQGWSSSSVLMVVEALLGVRPMAPVSTLLVDPRLPEWLPDLALEGLRIGQSTVDLRARRTSSGATRWWASTRTGPRILVLRQPQPYAPGANAGSRLVSMLASLTPFTRKAPPPD